MIGPSCTQEALDDCLRRMGLEASAIVTADGNRIWILPDRRGILLPARRTLYRATEVHAIFQRVRRLLDSPRYPN